MEKDSLQNELAAAYYTTAREELLKRLELRDHAIGFASTALTTLLGLGISDFGKFQSYFLILMSPVALGATFVVTDHASMIAYLAKYLETETQKYSKANPNCTFKPWESSRHLEIARSSEYLKRWLGEYLIISLPLLFGLLPGFPKHWIWTSTRTLSWTIDIVTILLIGVILIRHYQWNRRYFLRNKGTVP